MKDQPLKEGFPFLLSLSFFTNASVVLKAFSRLEVRGSSSISDINIVRFQ